MLGQAPRNNKARFDANNREIQGIMDTKNKVLAALLSNPSSTHLRSMYNEAHASCKRVLRNLENEWWLKLTAENQRYADSGDLQNFHSALKQVYGPSDRSLAPVRSQAGVLLTDGKDILNM